MFNSGANRSSLFGQQSSTFGQTSTNLFGSSTAAKPTSAFGTTAGGGLFASTPAATTSLFGQSTPQPAAVSAFGQPSGTTGGLFGQTPQKSLFGASTTTNAAGGALFGQTSTAATASGGLFGSTSTTSTSGGLFGQTAAQTVGTTVKFAPLIATDTMMKNGSSTSIQTKHECITTMAEYKNKSLEELRVDDYMANRKGGTAATTSAFGTSAPTTASLFGSTTAVLPVATGGLFGAAKPTVSTFGATTAAPAVGGLFGATAAAKPLFGATPAVTTGGLFGQPAATAPATGGLFGSTAAAPATTGGLFGGATAFGQQPAAAATSIFGAPAAAATTGGLFGKPAAATTAFGAPAAAAAPPFSFATQPAGQPVGGLFGAKPAATGLFGAAVPTGGLFGQAAAKPAFSFPATAQPAAAPTAFSFGAAQPVAVATAQVAQPQAPILIGTDTATQQAAQTLVNAQLAGLCNSPYSDKLGKLLNSADKAAQIDATDPRVHQAHLARRQAYPPTTSLGARPFMPGRMAPPQQRLVLSPNVTHTNQNASLLDELLDDSALATGAQAPRRSIKKLVIKPRRHTTVLTSTNQSVMSPLGTPDTTPRGGRLPTAGHCSPAPRMPSLDDSMNTTANVSTVGVSNRSTDDVFNLTQSDYYTIPSKLQLANMRADDGRLVVEDGLTVGRSGYGSVFWPGPVDITDVGNVELDELVIFRHKEITVYPDESCKPAQGSGLNRPAEITLERIFPTDKTTRQPITDVARLADMRFGVQLERKTAKMGAAFKDYRPDMGVWVFEVKHFSKYGLASDDEGDDALMPDAHGQRVKMTALDRLRRDERTHSRVQRIKLETSQEAANIVPDLAADLSYETQELMAAMTAVEENLVEFKATTAIEDERRGEVLLEHLQERAARLRCGGVTEEAPVADMDVAVDDALPVLRHVRRLPKGSVPIVVLDECTPHKCNRVMQPKLPECEMNKAHVKEMFALVRAAVPDDQGRIPLAIPLHKDRARLFDQYAQVAKENGAIDALAYSVCSALWGGLSSAATLSPMDESCRRRARLVAVLQANVVADAPSEHHADHLLQLMLCGRQAEAARHALSTMGCPRTALLCTLPTHSPVLHSLMDAQNDKWDELGCGEADDSQRALHRLLAGRLPNLGDRGWTAQLLAHLLYACDPAESMAVSLASFRQIYTPPTSHAAFTLVELYAGEATVGHVVDAALEDGDVSTAWHLAYVLASGGVVCVPEAVMTRVSVLYAPMLARHALVDEALLAVRHVGDQFLLTSHLSSLLATTMRSQMANIDEPLSVELAALVASNLSVGTLVYDALALHARLERRPDVEVSMAVHAGQMEHAHRVFLQQVAPAWIVDGVWDELGAMVTMLKEHASSISSWRTGGKVIFDYVGLRTMLADREMVASLEVDADRMAVVKARLEHVVANIDSVMSKHRRAHTSMRRTVWHWLSSVYSPAEMMALDSVALVADERLLDVMAVHAGNLRRELAANQQPVADM